MTLKPKSLIARTLALICTLGLSAGAWAATDLQVTVTAGSFVINNENAQDGGFDNCSQDVADSPTLTIPVSTSLPEGTKVSISTISLGKRDSTTAGTYPDKIKIVDGEKTYVSASKTEDANVKFVCAYTEEESVKQTYSFAGSECVLKVGTTYDVVFLNSSGNAITGQQALNVRVANNSASLFGDTVQWGAAWRPVQEITGDIVYTCTIASDGTSSWDVTPPMADSLCYWFEVAESASFNIGTITCKSAYFNVGANQVLTLSGAVTASSGVSVNGGTVSVAAANTISGNIKGSGTLQYVGVHPTTSVVLTDSAWTGTLWLKDCGSVDANNKTALDLSSVFYSLGNAKSTVRFTNVKAHVNNRATAAPFALELVDGERDGEYAWYNNNGWTSDSPKVNVAELKGTGTFYDEGNAGCRQILNFTKVSDFTGTIHVTGKRIGFGGDVFSSNDQLNAGLISIGGNVTVNLPSASPKFEATRFAVSANATLNVNSDNQTVGFANQGVRGTVTIANGATLTANTTDAIAYNSTGTVNVYGTLAMGGQRWTFGPSNILKLYPGASVTGTGDSENAAIDMNLANGTTVQVSKSDNESSGIATIDAPIRSNLGVNGKIIVDEGMTLVCNGRIFGDYSIQKQGDGKLIVGNIGENSTLPTLKAGTIEYLFNNVRDFSGYADGTFVEGASITLNQTKYEFSEGKTTVTGVPANIPVSLIKYNSNNKESLTVNDNGKAELIETPVISGSTVCWHDYEFNENYSDSGYGNVGVKTWGTDHEYLQDTREGRSENYYAYNATRLGPSGTVSFPTEWSAAIRCTVPEALNTLVVMFGNSQSDDMIGLASGSSAGQVKIVTSSGNNQHTEIASMAIASPTTSPHVFVFTKTADYVTVYCDGKLVKKEPVSITLGSDFQFGTMYKGHKSGSGLYEINANAKDTSGIVDYMRLYDFAIGDRVIQALAEENPYVSDAPIYTRTVSGDANWNVTDSWTKADNTLAAEPDPNGQATLTAEEDSVITVNVAASPVYESLTFDGDSKITLSLGEGAAKLGAVALNINTDVEISYGAFDLSASDISIAEGKTLTVDYTGYDFSGFRADTTLPLSAAISGEVHADRITIKCTSSYPAWIYSLSASFNETTQAYVLKIDVDEGHYNVWTAETAGSLTVAGNWKDNTVPTSADVAQINNGVKATLGENETFAAKNLFVGRGYVRQQNASGEWEDATSAANFQGAEIEMTGGTLNIANELWVGAPYADNHDSALSATAGTITAGALKMGDDAPGSNHKNVLSLSGTAEMTAGASQVGVYGGSINEVNVADTASLVFTGDLKLGSGAKTININGGTLAVGNNTTFNDAKWLIVNDNNTTLNLNGGELSICRLTAWADVTVVFNGGTLTAYGQGNDNAKVIGGRDDEANHTITLNVKAGGAIVKTDTNTTITPALQGDANSVGGGLTKRGIGTLTLAAAPTFTGAISVEAGKVVLPKGTYTLAAGTVVESDDGTNMTLAPGVAITVPSVANTTVTVKIGDTKLEPASDGKYYVVPGSTVTVTYSAAEDFAIADGTVVLEAVTEAQTVQAPTVSVVAETWTGAANDGSWNTAANWNHNVVPGRDVAVTFPAETTVTVTTGVWGNGNAFCKSLVINGNVAFDGGYVTSDNDITGTGTLTLQNWAWLNTWKGATMSVNVGKLVIADCDFTGNVESGNDIEVACPVEITGTCYLHEPVAFTGAITVPDGVNGKIAVSNNGATAISGNVTLGAGSSLTVPVTLGDNQFVKSETSYVKSESVEGGVKYTLDTYKRVTFSGGHMTVTRTDSLGDAIKAGDTVTFTVAPAENYKVESVMVGDTELPADNGIYSLVVDDNVEVAVTTALDLVTFTVEVPENTTVTVTGATLVEGNNYQASIGAEVTITYTPTGAYVGEAVQQVVTVTQNQAVVQAPAEYAPVPAVAQIGNDYYATLQAAVDQGDVTVKILGDVTLADKLVVDGGQTVVFEAVSAVTVTGQLRVVDGSNCTIGQNVTFTSADHPTVFVLGDPAVKTPGTAQSTLVVNGTVANTNPTFDGAFAISGNGLDTQGADITINGTVTNPNGIAIYQPQPGSLTVNGTVSGASAISIKDGTLTVGENAVVTAVLADGSPYVGSTNGDSPTGDAIIVPYYPASKGYGTPVVNIQGGTITVADTANCAGIEAYDFDGVEAPEDASSNVNVSGGTFNTPVKLEYCAAGVIPAENGSGSYGVEDGYVITWVVDDVETKMPVKAGVTPSYGENVPTKANYEFNGWTPTVVAATDNATYTATWTAKRVTLGTPAVVWGADFTNAVVSATVENGYDDVAYTLTYNSNVYAGKVENGKVTFNVPVDEDDRYEYFSYTIDAKFGVSSVGSAGGWAIVANETAWFSATATTTARGAWTTNPTVEDGRITFSKSNTFTPDEPSSGKIVVIDMGKVVFGDTNDTEINDAQAGIRIGSSGKFEVMSATGWTPTIVDADGEAVYDVVVSIDYKAKTYSVKVGNDTISGIALASSATKVTSIEFNGAGSLESLTGEYFEGAMVKDAKGATYDTVAAAIAALEAGTATAPLTMLHEGSAPDGWTIEEGVLTQASIVVESTDKVTLVAVPEECKADALINLSNRSAGDMLQVNNANGTYWSWELDTGVTGLYWKKVARVGAEPDDTPEASAYTLKAGAAVWVTRKDATKPIVLNATYAAAEAKVEVAVTTGWTLVAPLPKAEPFDLNNLSVKGGSFSDGDMIVIPGTAAPINCVRKDGKWKVYTITVEEDSNAPAGWGPIATGASWDVAPTVPAGKGFFFVSESEKTLEL